MSPRTFSAEPAARRALPGRRLRDFIDQRAATSPARLAIVSFLSVIAIVTALLCLPAAHQDPDDGSFAISLFTAVSAVCVTGLTPVVTEQHWSAFGLGVITAGIQVGGLGILTLASILGMAISKRLGVRQRLIAAEATNSLRFGQVGTLLRVVVITVVAAELLAAALLLPAFLHRGDTLLQAIWHSVFYAISAFNNAGFTIHPGGMSHFADDPWILIVVMTAVFVGSLGFPVILMVSIAWRRPRAWDLHTALTLVTSAVLVVVGFLLLLLFEAANPTSLGDRASGSTVLHTLFMAVMPRSGGFATVEVADLQASSHLLLNVLMFIGGGSSSTAGGIKVTTLAVLVLAALAEARGAQDVTAFRRRIDPAAIRLAISVTLAGSALVIVGTMVLLPITGMSLQKVLFEVISAFGTCGLSSGVTQNASDPALHVLSALMFFGRLGTITLAAGLSQRHRRQFFRYPEERPIIG